MTKWFAAFMLLAGAAQAQEQSITGITDTSMTTYSTNVIPSSYYAYDPKPDISAPELATIFKLLLPAITCRNVLRSGCDAREAIDTAAPAVKRHFTFHER